MLKSTVLKVGITALLVGGVALYENAKRLQKVKPSLVRGKQQIKQKLQELEAKKQDRTKEEVLNPSDGLIDWLKVDDLNDDVIIPLMKFYLYTGRTTKQELATMLGYSSEHTIDKILNGSLSIAKKRFHKVRVAFNEIDRRTSS